MAMFTLGYALFQTPSGKWADKVGPRSVIATIVTVWSALTALTGAAWNYVSMLFIRFFFGAGEAGAFPALSKVVFNWFPLKERGIVQGINFSGSRIGAAFALPLVAVILGAVGWRMTFVIFGAVGILFAILWWINFRNSPAEPSLMSEEEKDYILANREEAISREKTRLPFGTIMKSGNMWLAMGQYMASNFTFYFTLTWMYPFIKETFGLSGVQAGLLAMFPLLAGALGNWVSGLLVDILYRTRGVKVSRRIPAITGFALAAFGMVMMAILAPRLSGLNEAIASGAGSPESILQLKEELMAYRIVAIAFLSIAVFGADMTLSPSWAFCIDIGKEHAGAVSGTMNMAGNLGAFVTIIAFPYLYEWTGSFQPFFYVCMVLAALAIFLWLMMNPKIPILKVKSQQSP